MARRFHRRAGLSALSELNVTPLIDLAFALLIIFMITTPLLEQTIPLKLPVESTKNTSQNVSSKMETISINAQGQLAWGTQMITKDELHTRLNLIASEKTPPVLHIRADAQLSYQKVIEVMDIIKSHHLSKISLDTQVH